MKINYEIKRIVYRHDLKDEFVQAKASDIKKRNKE